MLARRCRIAALACVAGVVLAGCGGDGDQRKASLEAGAPEPPPPADEDTPVPKNQPKKGLVYEDLERGQDEGPCAGMLQVEVEGQILCTHGPDPAPPGVDVREPVSVAELRERTEEPPPAADNTDRSPPDAPSDAPAEASIPCVGSGADGKRVLAIYAHAADRASRFDALRPLIEQWAGQASGVFDASAAKTGGSRRIRFVTFPPPGCALSVHEVQLSAGGDDSFDNTVTELVNAGYNNQNRMYMVFVDANVYCGIGWIENDDRPGLENYNNGGGVRANIGRTDAGCWGRLGLGGAGSTEAHELVHNLGGIQLSAPNASGGWHCTDERDTECYSDSPNYPAMRQICPAEHEMLLDCNNDDYYNTDPADGTYIGTHWNVADSQFLIPGQLPVPANDPFAGAIALSGANSTRPGDYNSGAGKESGEPSHAGNSGGASVWYRWTAPAGGQVTVDTAGSSFDTTLGVYTGSQPNALQEVASNDDVSESDRTSKLSFEAISGRTYRIAVDGYNDGSGAGQGSVKLNVAQTSSSTIPPPPPPDRCPAARAALSQARAALRRAQTRLRRAKSPKPRKLKRAVASARQQVSTAAQAVQEAC